jgi:hypothetical protein
MAQQQEASMPGSLARPPRWEHRDKGEGMNSQVSSQRSEVEDHGGDTIGTATVMAVKPPSNGCDDEERHRAHGRAAKHSTWGATSGLQAHRPTDKATEVPPQAPRGGKKLQRGQPKQIEPRGQDPLGEARRRWRWMEARSTNPHGQMEVLDEAERLPHRAAAELAEACRNQARESLAIRDRQRGLGIGRDRVREEWGGSRLGRAGPVKPTRVDLTSGPRLSAPVLF